ncbi:sperm microtubule inner protein 8-like isoform X2 [Corticium candelabrum]|uniref:sperm microtubule inner protein 8-like isoform X2 n=1 Tax=Corticium candelabrum TaxID=121492 RepID=UPI002E26E695|nr:sperm microtubule inner protein 8-like isoform X2 [Corticium candelabrum]
MDRSISSSSFYARYKLAGIKTGIYNPRLPTFRRMDMDDAACRMCDEHSRTTTLCSHEEMEAAKDITDTGKSLRDKIPLLDEIPPFNWQSYLTAPSSLGNNQNATPQFNGYVLRRFSPAVTSSWKYCLRQEPGIDKRHKIPRPVPATIYSRHRDIFTTHNISVMAWH